MWSITGLRCLTLKRVTFDNYSASSSCKYHWLSDRPRPGAPRVTSVRQDNFIRQRHLRDRYVTAECTALTINGNRERTISRNTVRNRLRDRGIRCRWPYRGPARHRLERQQ